MRSSLVLASIIMGFTSNNQTGESRYVDYLYDDNEEFWSNVDYTVGSYENLFSFLGSNGRTAKQGKIFQLCLQLLMNKTIRLNMLLSIHLTRLPLIILMLHWLEPNKIFLLMKVLDQFVYLWPRIHIQITGRMTKWKWPDLAFLQKRTKDCALILTIPNWKLQL